MSASAALWRWNVRMLRREWRDHALVVLLCTGAVALCVAGAQAAYHAAPPAESLDYGTLLGLESDDPAAIDDYLERLGDTAVVQRGTAQVAGATDIVDTRAVDPDDPIVGPLVDLQRGALPETTNEIAITQRLASQLRADVGAAIELDGIRFDVVGIVENPTDLADDFVLLDHRSPPPLELATQYRTTAGIDAIDTTPFDGGISVSETDSPRTIATILSNIAMGGALLLIGLLTSAGFTVIANRRIRQFGVLGAIGVDERQLRRSAARQGAVVGLGAAVTGSAIGVVAAGIVMPRIEQTIGHRVDYGLRPTIVIPAVLVATAFSAIAAWWPARALARQPIVASLAATRPSPMPVRRTTVVGLIAAGVGFPLLAFGATNRDTLAALVGLVFGIGGVLLLAPIAVVAIGRVTVGRGVSVRIAGRDLARFQSRSAAALAAIVVALAIPVGVGVISAAADASEQTERPNLPDDMAIVWADGVRSSAHIPAQVDPEPTGRVVDRARASMPSLAGVPIQVAVTDEAAFLDDNGVRSSVTLQALTPSDCDLPIDGDVSSFDVDDEQRCFTGRSLWVSTPELAALLGVDDAAPTADRAAPALVGPPAAEFLIVTDPDIGPQSPTLVPADLPDFRSLPAALVDATSLPPDMPVVTIGWILAADEPLTDSFVASLQTGAATEGVALEVQSAPQRDTGLRLIAATIGVLAALCILGASVTLVRSEAAADNRLLGLLGAPPVVQRLIAGSTAALLALGGAVLALPLGYLALAVMRTVTTDARFAVPWSTVVIIGIVFPALAGAIAALSARPVDAAARRPAF